MSFLNIIASRTRARPDPEAVFTTESTSSTWQFNGNFTYTGSSNLNWHVTVEDTGEVITSTDTNPVYDFSDPSRSGVKTIRLTTSEPEAITVWNMFNDEITSISGVLWSLMSGVTEITMGGAGTTVADLSFVRPAMTNLTLVNYRFTNALTDISGLASVPSLERVLLTTNLVDDISPLFELPALDDVQIGGNPVSYQQYDTLLKALDDNGLSNGILDAGTIEHGPDGADARASLVSKGWTITDGGENGAALSDPEADLTLSATIPEGTAGTFAEGYDGDIVYACDLTIPANPDGLIYERGGLNLGMYIGFRPNGDFIYRVGSGTTSQASASDSETAVVLISAASAPSGEGTLVWDVDGSAGTIRVWWNRELIGTGVTTDGNFDNTDGRWTGANADGYFALGGAVDPTAAGETTTPLPATGISSLRYYDGQIVGGNDNPDPEEGLTESGTMTHGSTGVLGGSSGGDAVYACDLTIPASPSGIIYERGGSTTGLYIGFRSNGDFIYRVGVNDASQANASDDEAAVVHIPAASAPSGAGTLAWEIRGSEGRARAWWNNDLIGDAVTTDGDYRNTDGLWSGGNDDGYFAVGGGSYAAGEESAALAATGVSDLRYYDGQVSSWGPASGGDPGTSGLSGVLYDSDELTVWASRATSGPYKSEHDVATNTPGDWDRIVANKNTFTGNPSADRRSTIQFSNTTVYHNAHTPMKDAAFWSLVQDDATVAGQVKTELLWHEANTTPVSWPNTDSNNTWFVAEWVLRMFMAYDYTKHHFSSGEADSMDAWFSALAHAIAARVNDELDTNFPNRLSRDYSVKQGSATNQDGGTPTYAYHDSAGNPHNRIPNLAKWYNNRRSTLSGAFGVIGVHLGDATLIDQAKLYVEEWIKFSMFPDGTTGEYERAGDYGMPQTARNYNAINLQVAVMIAEALRRSGDLSLYLYSTSDGLWDTAGGPKSIKLAVDSTLDELDYTTERYWTSNIISNNRLDAIAEIGDGAGRQWVNEIWFAPLGNTYWQSTRIKQAYLRTTGTSEAYTKPFGTAGPSGNPWRGSGVVLPGCLFMYGDMED